MACVEEFLKMNPTPLVQPRFDVGRSRSGPTKILSSIKVSGHWSAVRPSFSTPLVSGVSSRRRRSILS
ncbi:hypothetical protein PanWU01x14_368480, partial [Parasponia andersonii]